LTYGRRSNPWQQLQELSLTTFLDRSYERRYKKRPVLELDARYLGDERVPLVRIAKQSDQPTALADVISFGAYLLRLMISIHVWSFRRPDAAEPREPQRLPGVIRCGRLRRRRIPKITELDVGERPDGTPVRVRLTHYEPPRRWRDRVLFREPAKRVPIVMIHGYSASGTTFAHDAVRPNLAAHFLARQRDVWIVDLRTSSGMPTARMPWSFEDAALVDLPAALAHVQRETATETNNDEAKLDIIAHCMGAAMLSMAVLAMPVAGAPFFREREKLPGWINRAVLSQIGPMVEFSPANVLRGYVLSYIRDLLPIERYEFRTSPDPTLTDQLIDRLLATLPYPKEEFDIENPPWWQCWRTTPWVGTRHRMDALYARDFDLVNIPRRVLKHIDDLFGPLSIETVSQGIHFARRKVITNRAGRNVYVSPRQLNDRWSFPTLSIHGVDNGLADVATLGHMRRTFKEAGLTFKGTMRPLLTTRSFREFGHQDSLIGRRAGKVFKDIERFLDDRPLKKRTGDDEDEDYWRKVVPSVRAEPPWLGPHRGPSRLDGAIPIRAGTDPGPDRTGLVAFLPVSYKRDRERDRDRFVRLRDPAEGLLLAAPLDPDGWIRFNLPVPERWGREAEGILMLTLNEEPQRIGAALFDERFAKLRAALRGSQIQLTLNPSTAHGDLQATFQQALSTNVDERIAELEAIKAYIDKVRPHVLKALARRLRRPAKDNRHALIVLERSKPELCFAFGSCQYPAGLLDAEIATESMEQLKNRLGNGEARPQFVLLLGDQVYVDATAGLFDPTSLDDRFVRPYERLYERPPVQDVLRQVPSYMMLDDHEIDDNWEPTEGDVRSDERLRQARRSYWRYQRFESFDNPGQRERNHELSFSFEHADHPFYVLDTRTQRASRTAGTVLNAELVSKMDLANLKSWLSQQQVKRPDKPKFIASPAMPLPRHLFASGSKAPASALRSDGWDGYPRSLLELLAFIAKERILNVVFLSGDAHLSCIAKATLEEDGSRPLVIHSIHSSALYAPFPFANSLAADFANPDKIKSDGYVWTVKTEFVAPPGDGFMILYADSAQRASLRCEFVGRNGPSRPRSLQMQSLSWVPRLSAPPERKPLNGSSSSTSLE
jgi:hypothetical protein